jgi:hypothetical protein
MPHYNVGTSGLEGTMQFDPVFIMRACGAAGILGALLLIAGDLLYQYVPGSAGSVSQKMSKLTSRRLMWAGSLGLPASWLYAAGAAQLYFAFQPAGRLLAGITAAAFGAVMLAYGAAHIAYFAIASGALVAVQSGLDPELGGKPGKRFYDVLVKIIYVPVVIASGLMVYLVATGQSLYPRWMLIFLPLTLYVLKTPIVKLLPRPAAELVRDSYDNQVLLVFFCVSTVLLWRGAGG